MTTPLTTIRNIAVLAIGVIMVISMGVIGWQVYNLTQLAALAEVRGGKIQDTSTIQTGGSRSAEDRARSDSVATSGRGQYNQELQDAFKLNPDLAERHIRPIPIELRNLAKTRRIARDRFGCNSDNCPN